MTQTPAVSAFEIRPATGADVPIILGLIRELADYERLSKEVVATEADLHHWLFGEKPVAEILIGEYGGKPVSFALFFYNFSTFLGKPGVYLEDLYVKPDYRHKGFGRRLMAYIAQWAKAKNCGRFEWAVLNWNTPAIELYENLGAVPQKEWTVYRLSGEALEHLADEHK
ncbi:MAG: GNAT family N-acetyltransferase [Deltaproteobacteria bacterium]|jgi:GNAT superfamily N-acetyltransferase|nr:GNAT family N-acetyltransferase [Deltaproteobacteria bacterium]